MSIQAALPGPDGGGTVVLVRTNHADAAVHALVAALRDGADHLVCLAADETNGPVDPGPDAEKIVLVPDELRRMGLHVDADALWRCGDYALYAAQRRWPAAGHFWMIEPDVRIHAARPAEFFAFFDRHRDVDLLACRYGESNPGWWWYRSMRPYADRVYNCMFPITRFSGRAIRFLFERRVALAQRHAAALAGHATGPAPVWPNDEAFSATELSNGGFDCRDLNGFGRPVHTGDSFTFTRPISADRLDATPPDGLLYHPVLSGERFGRKLRNLLDGDRHETPPAAHFIRTYTPAVLQDLRHECGDAAADAFAAEVALAVMVADTPAGRAPDRVGRHAGLVVETELAGTPVAFLVRDRHDHIGSHHHEGRFYEDVELAIIGKHMPPGCTFVDVGAHVGNHLLYAGLFLHPGRIVPIEPNPDAAATLRCNVAINRLHAVVDLGLLGIALSNVDGTGTLAVDPANTGLARVLCGDAAATGPACRIARGDALFRDIRLDFVKLDVGGHMEWRVLDGMRGVLRRDRPLLFLHVPHAQREPIGEWLAAERYRTVHRHARYADGESLMLLPDGS